MKKTVCVIAVLFVVGISVSNAQHVSVRIGFPVGTRVVAPGPAPFSGAIWIGPEWRWRGNQYVVTDGYWARPRHARAVWVPGYWKQTRRGYKWVQGYWR